MAKTGKYTGWNFCLRLAIYKPYPYYKVKTRIFAIFLPPPAEIFCKRRSWLTSIIANCPAKGSGIFSKNLSGSQSHSQRETLFKGIGMLPNKQNLRFSASPEIVVLSVCIYKRPACPVAHGCCFRPPSTKISAKALTGTSVCATIMEN